MCKRGYALCIVTILTLVGCGPRPELLLVVDTDAPIPAQVSSKPGALSADAAIDSVRVDAIDATGRVFEVCEFAAPNRGDWPLSFGVVRPAGQGGGDAVRVRVRGFRRRLASPDRLEGVARVCGKDFVNPETVSVSEPIGAVTIDRLIEVRPGEGLQALRVVLTLDCMGASPSFAQGKTCVDGAQRLGTLTEGLRAVSDRSAVPSVIGSAPAAHPVQCDETRRPAKRDVVCVPGGFSILGDLRLAGIGDPVFDPVPLRAAVLSPFFLDRTEYTVQGWRDLVKEGVKPPIAPIAKNPAGALERYCTYDPNSDGRLPLNCVPYQSAAFVCAHHQGSLPSEAQWEHAARGRGQGWVFPWGDTNPSCCTASLARIGPGQVECTGRDMEPVGSHQGGCPVVDQSPDGVLDLVGSVSEYLGDNFRPYNMGCGLDRGLTRDPQCRDAQAEGRALRGSYWNASLLTGVVARRNLSSVGPANGFRCAYPGIKP